MKDIEQCVDYATWGGILSVWISLKEFTYTKSKQ